MKSTLLFLFSIFVCSVVISQDINFDDLKRPGRPLSKSATISGIAEEASNYMSKFDEVDTGRRESLSAARSVQTTSSGSYCSSSDTCFNIASSSKDEVTIKCIKGPSHRIGQTYRICGPNSKGKWAAGCGITNTFAYHYSFKEAGNYNCKD